MNASVCVCVSACECGSVSLRVGVCLSVCECVMARVFETGCVYVRVLVRV